MADSSSEILTGGMFVKIDWSTANIVIFSICVVSVFSLLGYEYMLGIPYSKFAKDEHIAKSPGVIQRALRYRINMRVGWVIVYGSAALGYAILFCYYAVQNQERIGKFAPSELYSLILLVGWEANFIKRILECIFLHIFSDTIPLVTIIMVAFGYTHLGLLGLYFSNQVEGYEVFSSSDSFTKDIVCIVGFCIGMSVNFYAHVRLRNVRKQSDHDEAHKRYFSLEELGCLFKTFVCPQYVFEILHFSCWGVFGATPAHYLFAVGVTAYLSMRTKATYQWYKAKGLVKKSGVQEQAIHYVDA